MYILDPLICGFVKVITFDVLTAKHTIQQRSGENVCQFEHRILNNQYNRLQSIFGDALFNVPFNTFRNKYHQIVEQIWGIAKKKVKLLMYLTKKPGLSYHQKKKFAFDPPLSRMSWNLRIHLSKIPYKRTSSETKSRTIQFNERKSTKRSDK